MSRQDALRALVELAYWHGWKNAAGWAQREDLLADRGSRAYMGDRDNDLAELLREHGPALLSGGGDGVLVPQEPTVVMVNAGFDASGLTVSCELARRIYCAMVAVAPHHPGGHPVNTTNAQSDALWAELAPSSVQAFAEALNGPRGSLDAWLEVNDETEVRAHVRAYAALASSPPALGGDAVRALAALDGRAPGDPLILSRVSALSALLAVAGSPEDYAEAWSEDPNSMRECLDACRELARLGSAALTATPAPAVGREAETVTEYDVDSRSYSEYPVCTCPSGDGSLRWPCPQHPPAEAREPVGDEQIIETCKAAGLVWLEPDTDPDEGFPGAFDLTSIEQMRRLFDALAQPQATPRDSGDALCPNCVSPWKCNGPHIGEPPASGYEDATRQAQGGGEETP